MTRPRSGIGFDLHKLVSGPPLILGGVEIPSELGPEAHSDGDVLIHATCDALLGATGNDDIGSHFPDSDPEYDGLSGEDMAEEVLDLIHEQGFQLYQMDSTLVLEAPKLNPHKQQIKASMSELLELSASDIGLKATTMEGLGDIGEGQAIAAWVSVMVTGTS
jgi:2-C-methyl-D-erythritol 2,4-cyclodiphosphate synthase